MNKRKKYFEELTAGTDFPEKYGNVQVVHLEKEEFDSYYAYADQINIVEYSRGWMDDFREEMSAFLRGEVSYEEAAENARKKLEFYLSE